MSKVQVLDPTFENLVETYISARSRAGVSILEMSIICLRAKEQLKKKKWLEWLEDSRINLKRTQAKKLIAVAKICQQGGQLTDLLNRKGIEETYLLAKIPDDSVREELAGQILDADFTVKQTKQVVSIIRDENKAPDEAVEMIKEIKNFSKAPTSKQERKTVPIEQFNQLQLDYEQLLKVKQELEIKLQELSETTQQQVCIPCKNEASNQEELQKPVKTELPEFTLNKQKRSVVIKGWELPIPSAINIDQVPIDSIKMAAVNNAKNNHSLDLS